MSVIHVVKPTFLIAMRENMDWTVWLTKHKLSALVGAARYAFRAAYQRKGSCTSL